MKRIWLYLLLGLWTTSAYAHHPLGGMPMETFVQGLLSGIGHPILGFDHLFFIALVGIVSLFSGQRYVLPAIYIAAMLLGCLMMSQDIGLPVKELVIASSLLILGLLALSGVKIDAPWIGVLFVVFGLFHGSAFGDTIAGQEAGAGIQVLIGYLLGLSMIQFFISVGLASLMQKLWNNIQVSSLQPRLAGAMVAGVGLFLTLEYLETTLLDLWLS